MKWIEQYIKESKTINNLNKLNDLLKELDNKYNINDGYCGYVAYIIAKHLESHNIDYNIIQYFDNSDFLYHICIEVHDIILNDNTWNPEDGESFYTKQVNWTSKDIYKYHKENYKPNLSYYWKKSNEYKVNKSIKDFLNNL